MINKIWRNSLYMVIEMCDNEAPWETFSANDFMNHGRGRYKTQVPEHCAIYINKTMIVEEYPERISGWLGEEQIENNLDVDYFNALQKNVS